MQCSVLEIKKMDSMYGYMLEGVFHGDVNPGNFLFACKTNKRCLTDLGVAQSVWELQICNWSPVRLEVLPFEHHFWLCNWFAVVLTFTTGFAPDAWKFW